MSRVALTDLVACCQPGRQAKLGQQPFELSARVMPVFALVEQRGFQQHGRQAVLDVERPELRTVRLRDRRPHSDHTARLAREIDGDEYPLKRLATRHGRHEHRSVGQPDDSLGRGAHKKARHGRPRVRAHDDQVGLELLGQFRDERRRQPARRV